MFALFLNIFASLSILYWILYMKQISMQQCKMSTEELKWSVLGGIHYIGIEHISYNLVMHGNEATSKYQKLLKEKRFIIPLFYNFKCHAPHSFSGIDNMFAY